PDAGRHADDPAPEMVRGLDRALDRPGVTRPAVPHGAEIPHVERRAARGWYVHGMLGGPAPAGDHRRAAAEEDGGSDESTSRDGAVCRHLSRRTVPPKANRRPW